MESQDTERGDWISSGHFEAVLASAMDAIITIDGDQNIVYFNVAAELMFDMKKGEAIGQPLLNLIPEASREGHDKHVQLFRDTGVTGRRMGALGAISGRRSNGTTFRIEAGISQANVGGTWLATVILRDITERLAIEEARQLLSQEVDHRAKNALTVVHAIVKLTTAESTAQYVEAITGRLDALARAHGMLAKGSWTGGDLRQIIDEELIGFQRTGQVGFDGPKVTLSVKSVQPFSMLFHELATNAVRHGALSVDGGTVAVRWEVDQRGALLLHWTEAGGPAVAAPDRQGFGSSLIESLGDQLRSRQTSNWLPGGLHFTIELPAAAFKVQRQPIDHRAGERPAQEARSPRPGRRGRGDRGARADRRAAERWLGNHRPGLDDRKCISVARRRGDTGRRDPRHQSRWCPDLSARPDTAGAQHSVRLLQRLFGADPRRQVQGCPADRKACPGACHQR
jgi:PAS domain S-box-containing protein